MTPETVVLQTLSPEDWRLFRVLRLEALREAPYAFSTALADWQGDGDDESRWRARLTDVPLNVVAHYEGTPVGMASATAPTNGTTQLISMWVAPHGRGKGVATALIDAVVSWGSTMGVEFVSLDVREENHYARSSYERYGFVDRGRIDASEPFERRMLLRLD